MPVRTVRLALRYVITNVIRHTSLRLARHGINAFDTSPYYGVSEIVLGACLKALEAEFPRSSYVLVRVFCAFGDSGVTWSS